MQLYLYPEAVYIAAVLLTAVILDLLFGDPPTRFHPVAAQGSFISFLWSHRPKGRGRRGLPVRLFLYGLFIIVSGALASFFVVFLLQTGMLYLWKPEISVLFSFLSVLLSAALLKGSFSFRNLLLAGKLVSSALAKGDVNEGRRLVSYHLVSRDTSFLDSSALASAALESLSENFTDSVTAPFFFYGIGGPAASWVYRFINTSDAMLGYREGDKEWGGKAAARVDDILSWLPARFAGIVISISALPAGLDFREAFRVMFSDARKCSSPNSGWSMAAAAGALGVRLVKENHYVLNEGGRAPLGSDIKRLNRLLYWSLGITLPPVLGLSFLVLSLIQRII